MNLKTPCTIWLMGPTSSGKTTISKKLVDFLHKSNFLIVHYDGDEIRNLFGEGFNFTEKNRFLVIKTLVYLANKANQSGIPAIISALTAHKNAREYVKANIKDLCTVYIECPINVCSERDPKGLYAKAKRGEINTLIGYNSNYVPPRKPNITINTHELSINESINKLLNFLKLPSN